MAAAPAVLTALDCRCSPRSAAFVLILALLGSASVRCAEKTPEQVLAEWVREKGAKLHGATIGHACATCPRGVLASRDLQAGDEVLSVPLAAGLRLDAFPEEKTRHFLHFYAESARQVVLRMHTEPRFNSTWAPYLAGLLSPKAEALTAEGLSDAHIAQLQHPDLEDLFTRHRDDAIAVYEGRFWGHPYPPLHQELPAGTHISLATFLRLSSLVGTHAAQVRYSHPDIGPLNESGEGEALFLVPFFDMVNHSDQPNVDREEHGLFATMRAAQPIKKGEEVFFNYMPGLLHRPDMALFLYGIVAPLANNTTASSAAAGDHAAGSEQEQVPQLCVVDGPGYSYDDVFAYTKRDEELYEAPGSELVTHQELTRLRSILHALPTSEAVDVALLQSGAIADWKERAVVQFRVWRKRALRLRMQWLQAKLERGDMSTSGQDMPPAAAAGLAAGTASQAELHSEL